MASEMDMLKQQYELEREYAERIKKAQPFSEERAQITKEAYQKVNAIIEMRNQNTNAFGFNIQYSDMVLSFLRKEDTFFEAGAGTGALIGELRKNPEVNVMGCDTFLDPRFWNENLRQGIMEDTLFHSLMKLEDESIDLFFWNDVIEHICPDEISETLNLLYKKMKHGGTVLTVTPNALTGPHDITAYAAKEEKTAQGLHLKEYTYTEVAEVFHQSGFITRGHYIRQIGKNKYTERCCLFNDKLRFSLEKILRLISFKKLSSLFVYFLELNVSVMQKP